MEARPAEVISASEKITPAALFLRACRREPVPRVPVWMMRQAGRYLPEYRALREKHSFLEVAKTPELAAEVSLQPYRRLGVDAVIVFSDILIPAEAMGAPIELGDAGPVITSPVRTEAQVEALSVFDPERETRFVGDAIRLLRKSLGPEIPVLGFAAAPWTLACYLVQGASRDGFPAAKALLWNEPRTLRKLLEKIARATARYLKAQIAAGAAAVQLFDTWAGELDASAYRDFELPATQLLIEELAAGDTPVILFSKASNHLIDSLGANRRQCAERGLAHGSGRASAEIRPSHRPSGQYRSLRASFFARCDRPFGAAGASANQWPRPHPQPRPWDFARDACGERTVLHPRRAIRTARESFF